ncbi:MAG: aminotransferase class I/II-fold pyridoxal phosphate-dependent enzyme [Muribaculaceae bacterium]|nr:aminotransferase class I/II-fold pyridoxal phosphate-dependent enzyme [Muribaculaceae bacterium]
MIEGHGDDLYRYGDKIRHNFSTNIISNADHSGLKEYLKGVLDKIGSYPEPAPFSLEAKIAAKLGVKPENVVVTNGATDAMYRIASLYYHGCSAIVTPTFREYQDACDKYDQDMIFFNDIEEITDDVDLVWVCNPNNPTGKGYAKGELHRLAKELPNCMIVVDQAYADYTKIEGLTAREAVELGNVILLSSLTKRYAVPGLRIGYLVTSEAMAREIRKTAIPWNVNTLAIEAGKYLLEHDEDYVIPVEMLCREARRIAESFREMGIKSSDTCCNFILCQLPEGSSAELKEYLVEHYGILIRDASNFEGLDERYFRVAAQSPEENDLLIEGVKEWLKNRNC